jgi:serine/threonine-protein kinase SRK2
VQHHKSLPELQARWLFQQLILALEYCHSSGVSNRDIKLENILLDKSNRGRPDWPILKICDWGYARAGHTSEASSKVGTLSYMAPEVLTGDSYSTKRADIWSCGVVLYAMLVSAALLQGAVLGVDPAGLHSSVTLVRQFPHSSSMLCP